MLYDVHIYSGSILNPDDSLSALELTEEELKIISTIFIERGFSLQVSASPDQQDWIGLSRLALAGQAQPACQAFRQWGTEIRT